MAEWELREGPTQSWIDEVAKATGLAEPVLRVCFGRGLLTAESILQARSPKLSELPDPNAIYGVSHATQILEQHRSDRVRVFGDYDVDGTCGAALLETVLKSYGFQVDAEQPDRFRDGYGLNTDAVRRAVADKISLLVTVDCGITSFEALELACELGLKVIVVDHHRVSAERGLPRATVIIDPHQSACQSGLTELCGTGLAFMLLMALRTRGRQAGWFAHGSEPNLRNSLDLVAVATACDQVPLGRVNRLLVHHGMRVVREGRRAGLKALLEIARASRTDLPFSQLSFLLGPRINASGRMASASHAFKLLTTQSEREAYGLALELNQLNLDRATTQELVTTEAISQVEAMPHDPGRRSTVVSAPHWHEGVVGIVATRLVERFGVVAVVLSEHEGLLKGSLRAPRGKDVLAALEACRDCLVSFGGHRAAAGVRLHSDRLEEFRARFEVAVRKQTWTEERLLLDASLDIGDLSLEVLEQIEELGPYGVGHPEPVFGLTVHAKVLGLIKGQHLKLSLGSTAQIEGIWFRAPEATWDQARLTQCAVVPEVNRFRGRKRPVLRLKDLRQENV